MITRQRPLESGEDDLSLRYWCSALHDARRRAHPIITFVGKAGDMSRSYKGQIVVTVAAQEVHTDLNPVHTG